MLRKLIIPALAAALGVGAATGVAACGEDRGSVQIQGDTATGTAGTSNTETNP